MESNTAKIIITVPQNTPAKDIDAFSFVAVDKVHDDFGEETEVEIQLADALLSVKFEGDVARISHPKALQTGLRYLLVSLQDTLADITGDTTWWYDSSPGNPDDYRDGWCDAHGDIACIHRDGAWRCTICGTPATGVEE